MDNFSSKVRVFDAFPKVSPEHSVRSSRGGLSSVFTILFGLFILWIQIGGFLGGYIDRQFSVNKKIELDLDINVDLMVAMPCDSLVTNVMDITNDNFLASEVLNFVGVDFIVPPYFNINNQNDHHKTQNLDQAMEGSLRAEYAVKGKRFNTDAPACHIFGLIPVNHVKGEFFIAPKGAMYYLKNSVPLDEFNLSHSIYEFSFGEFYPFMDNPLDFTAKKTSEKAQVYNYYAKVVPTLYEKIGLEIDTYQYSLTEIHHKSRGRGYTPPGIFFTYSFEPIKLSIREKRISFFAFVSRIATILSGLFIAAGYLYRLYERVLLVLFGKKFVDRNREKKEGGLLNHLVPQNKDY